MENAKIAFSGALCDTQSLLVIEKVQYSGEYWRTRDGKNHSLFRGNTL